MGMFNEVYTYCPKCGTKCEEQIPQIVYGFGGFNLHEPDSLADELDESQLCELRKYVNDLYFYCQICGHGFTHDDPIGDNRKKLARKLFG